MCTPVQPGMFGWRSGKNNDVEVYVVVKISIHHVLVESSNVAISSTFDATQLHAWWRHWTADRFICHSLRLCLVSVARRLTPHVQHVQMMRFIFRTRRLHTGIAVSVRRHINRISNLCNEALQTWTRLMQVTIVGLYIHLYSPETAAHRLPWTVSSIHTTTTATLVP